MSPFFFNDPATTEIYTLSLHDALPISLPPARLPHPRCERLDRRLRAGPRRPPRTTRSRDRKSTRLNSSHGSISYAVFCLKKKKTHQRSARAASTTAGVAISEHDDTNGR